MSAFGIVYGLRVEIQPFVQYDEMEEQPNLWQNYHSAMNSALCIEFRYTERTAELRSFDHILFREHSFLAFKSALRQYCATITAEVMRRF